jgi:hypothetical protein
MSKFKRTSSIYVVFVNNALLGIKFPIFEVNIGNLDFPPFPPFSTPTPNHSLQNIHLDQVFPDDNENLLSIIDRVEVLENGNTRWHFSFWNQSTEYFDVQVDYEETYLVDEFGNRYDIITDQRARDSDDIWGSDFNAYVRSRHWIEFSALQPEATKIQVFIGDTFFSKVNFTSFEVELE